MQIPWYIGWPIVIAFVVGILFMVASRTPYYPIKYPSGFWELQRALRAEDVWLLTADGVRLHGWWVTAPQASLVTLYLHGNAGNITHRFLPIREITAAGSSVLMLDYRGYGKRVEALQANTAYMQMPMRHTCICWITGIVPGRSFCRANRWAPLLLWILPPERSVLV